MNGGRLTWTCGGDALSKKKNIKGPGSQFIEGELSCSQNLGDR